MAATVTALDVSTGATNYVVTATLSDAASVASDARTFFPSVATGYAFVPFLFGGLAERARERSLAGSSLDASIDARLPSFSSERVWASVFSEASTVSLYNSYRAQASTLSQVRSAIEAAHTVTTPMRCQVVLSSNSTLSSGATITVGGSNWTVTHDRTSGWVNSVTYNGGGGFVTASRVSDLFIGMSRRDATSDRTTISLVADIYYAASLFFGNIVVDGYRGNVDSGYVIFNDVPPQSTVSFSIVNRNSRVTTLSTAGSGDRSTRIDIIELPRTIFK